MGSKTHIYDFLRNNWGSFCYIPAFYRGLWKNSFVDGICKKVMICTPEPQILNDDLVEIGFTLQMDIVFWYEQ